MRFTALLLLPAAVVLAEPVVVERVEHAGAAFRVVRSNPQQVQVVWKDESGDPYRGFDQVQAAFSQRGKTVRFIMNAGIFEMGGIPCGLHVEHGKTLHALNLADAPGNFFLKPNGVFRIEKEKDVFKAFVSPSEAYPKSGPVLHAVQSGPLLLTNGKRHPAFKEGSSNKLLRNGVGVDDKGRVVFAITDRGQNVNLWDFAGLFLKLNCQNALFLDGVISAMSANPKTTVKSNQFGAMFIIAD